MTENVSKKVNNDELEAYEEFMRIQREEMLGEVSRYFAYLNLNREPTEAEAAMHYILYGGAENFRQKYGHLVCILPQNEKK